MAHARALVRHAFTDALYGLTTTGANVFVNPMYLIGVDDLPALRVFAGRDAENVDDYESEMGDYTWRELIIQVEAIGRTHANDTTISDVLDTICAEVEVALMADATLIGMVVDLALVDTLIEVSNEAEEPTGTATMTWRVVYRTSGSNPTAVA